LHKFRYGPRRSEGTWISQLGKTTRKLATRSEYDEVIPDYLGIHQISAYRKIHQEFPEKPVAVDAPDVRSAFVATEVAWKKGLSLPVGLQTWYSTTVAKCRR
jgi:hypothetical protein